MMALALVMAQRSIDPSTKHGCVITNQEHEILSVGYNSPPQGCDDKKIPLTRPLKYKYFEHAESNAILNAAKTGTSLKGAIFYITGNPCEDCFRKLMRMNPSKIVTGPITSACISPEDEEAISVMKQGRNIEFVQIDDSFVDVLQDAIDYLDVKTGKIAYAG